MVIDNLERYFLIVVLGQFFVSTKLRFDSLEERMYFKELRSLFTPDFSELG